MTQFRDDLAAVIQASDLSMREVAALFGISRQMLYRWLDKSAPYHRDTIAIAKVALPALQNAIALGLLPFPNKLHQDFRAARLGSMSGVIRKLAGV